jgi:Ca2+/Na+ antiporter
MKKTKIIYWILTGLFAFLMLGSAIPDIFSSPIAVKGMHEDLGYPIYFIPFIGVAKLLGVVAILVPGYPRLKEWAYAGLIFDLLGATYSIFAAGQPVSSWIFMVLPISLAAFSYIFYHKKRKISNDAAINHEYEKTLVRNAA